MMQSIHNGEGTMFFLDARGGTGKTLTLNTLLTTQRTVQHNNKTICLVAVATSGIAATLLSLGRTFHSRFKVPLFCDKDKNVTFGVRPTDILATVIKSAMII